MSWKYRPDEVSVMGLRDMNLGAQTLTAAATLTAASPRINFLALAGGFTVTLPAPAEGLEFIFVAKVAPTTAYIIAAATADTMSGSVVTPATGAADTEAAATGSQWNFVASTAVAGDRVHLVADGTSWHGFGVASVAGGITITG